MQKVTLYIILCTSIFSCKQHNSHEELETVQELRVNNVLSREYSKDKQGRIQGELKTYYENGQSIFESANYRDSLLSGSRKLYFITGVMEVEENYVNGILQDTVYLYYPSGKLKKKSPYRNGTLTGKVTRFYENGQMLEEVMFSNNEENGPFVEYHPNGTLKWIGQYLNGNREFGELLQYDSTGVLIKKMICDSLGICKTTWRIEP